MACPTSIDFAYRHDDCIAFLNPALVEITDMRTTPSRVLSFPNDECKRAYLKEAGGVSTFTEKSLRYEVLNMPLPLLKRHVVMVLKMPYRCHKSSWVVIYP